MRSICADGDHHHRDRADRHRQRRDRRPRRLDVGVGVGEQLAGGVALVPLERQPEVLTGDGAAVVGLHAVLHDRRHPSGGPRCSTPRTIATPMNSASAVTSPPVVATPVSKAGSTTLSADQPSTQASATVSAPKRTAPSVEIGEHPRLAPDRDAEDREPVPQGAASVDASGRAVTTLLGGGCGRGRHTARDSLRPHSPTVGGRSAGGSVGSPGDLLRCLTNAPCSAPWPSSSAPTRPRCAATGPSGPRRPPARPGGQPGRRRASSCRRWAASSTERATGSSQRGVRRPGDAAAARPAALVAVRAAEGRRAAQPAGVLRPPRGRTPRAAGLATALAPPPRARTRSGRRPGTRDAGWSPSPAPASGSSPSAPTPGSGSP